MSVGVVILVHTAFDRAEQVIRHWVDGGCPVVVHVDSNVAEKVYSDFVTALADLDNVVFSQRFRCEWGTWGLVAASQVASATLLEMFADVQRVYLASGACLQLRPVSELRQYLEEHPDTDFIESATTADVPWTVGGLDKERFTLRFPFSWKRRRRLFDAYVKLQQMVRFRRRIPAGIVPHMGSQWWCLTRKTLTAILNDPRRRIYDKYFQKVWIPDECYYQTLTRLHSTKIESRSLTLSKFDFQGKPHILYDDHLELLRRSNCFVARKVWPQANLLYDTFPRKTRTLAEPSTTVIDRIFASAVDQRVMGRHGLYMQSRYPNMERENGFTAAPYSVLQGFDEIFPDFTGWLSANTGGQIHGRLYAKDRAYFTEGETIFTGGLSNNARLRDYNGKMFLTNLIWNARDRHQCFQFGPADTQGIVWMMAKDTNAYVSVISGAWAIPLFLSGRAVDDIRQEAAHLQRIEHKQLKVLRSPQAHARIRIHTLADFIDAPMDTLQLVIDDIAGHRGTALTQTPKMVDLNGFGAFLQALKNKGMHLFLTGDFSVETRSKSTQPKPRKAYVVGQK